MFLKQMVTEVGKVDGSFTCLFIRYGILKLLDGKQLTVSDLLSSIYAQVLSFEQQETGI